MVKCNRYLEFMKTLILALIGLGLCVQARGATLSTTDSATPTTTSPPNAWIRTASTSNTPRPTWRPRHVPNQNSPACRPLNKNNLATTPAKPGLRKSASPKPLKITGGNPFANIDAPDRAKPPAPGARCSKLTAAAYDRLVAQSQANAAQAVPYDNGANYGWYGGGGIGLFASPPSPPRSSCPNPICAHRHPYPLPAPKRPAPPGSLLGRVTQTRSAAQRSRSNVRIHGHCPTFRGIDCSHRLHFFVPSLWATRPSTVGIIDIRPQTS